MNQVAKLILQSSILSLVASQAESAQPCVRQRQDPSHSASIETLHTWKTWDQIAAFVGHLDQRTTQRYIHFMPKDKRETANSIPFEF